MSAGFDDRVEARLIGLRMASDGLTAIVGGSPHETIPSQETNNRSSLSDQSIASSSVHTSLSSNGSFNSNASVTARRSVEKAKSCPSTSSDVFLDRFRVQLPDHALSLSEQALKNAYHKFVQNNLIIKQGILDKKKVNLQALLVYLYFSPLRKGLFAKRRMFLITEGPAIFYVDPDAMELKGTISWLVQLSAPIC